jgi:hypothetical protein
LLTGTPTSNQAGTYSNIQISVSDGNFTQSLAAFSITVTRTVTGSATLSWTAPSQNTDGSALTELAGYRVYHGTSAIALNEMIQVPGAGTTTYTKTALAAGTHYFALTAYTTAGVESLPSAMVWKVIP